MTGPTEVAVWTSLGLLTGATLTGASRRLITSRPSTPLLVAASAGATAVLFALSISRTATVADLLAYSVFAAIGVQVAAIDLIDLRLPKALIWPTFGALLVLLAASAASHGEHASLIRAAAGAAMLVAFYLAIAVVSRGGLGAGDVRLAAPVGLMLAWHDWPTLLTGTIVSFLGSCVLAAVTIATRHSSSRSAVPHGPAMLTGAFAAMIA